MIGKHFCVICTFSCGSRFMMSCGDIFDDIKHFKL